METCIEMVVNKNGLRYFFPLFQKGVAIKIRTGITIKDLFALVLQIPAEYTEGRIQTIFLDGKAVDNLEEAKVRDGSTLALSAAMPGLVGATLRRGGTFASLRRAITLTPETEAGPQKEGRMVIKLFNLLVSELAPALLGRGILLKGDELQEFLEGLQEEFWENCQELVFCGQRLENPFKTPDLMDHKNTLILLKVLFKDS